MGRLRSQDFIPCKIMGHRGYPKANDIGVWYFQPSWNATLGVSCYPFISCLSNSVGSSTVSHNPLKIIGFFVQLRWKCKILNIQSSSDIGSKFPVKLDDFF